MDGAERIAEKGREKARRIRKKRCQEGSLNELGVVEVSVLLSV
jgi:hypothetical protein